MQNLWLTFHWNTDGLLTGIPIIFCRKFSSPISSHQPFPFFEHRSCAIIVKSQKWWFRGMVLQPLGNPYDIKPLPIELMTYLAGPTTRLVPETGRRPWIDRPETTVLHKSNWIYSPGPRVTMARVSYFCAVFFFGKFEKVGIFILGWKREVPQGSSSLVVTWVISCMDVRPCINWATKRKNTFHYTGCLIAIRIMVYHVANLLQSPHNRVVQSPINPKQPGALFPLLHCILSTQKNSQTFHKWFPVHPDVFFPEKTNARSSCLEVFLNRSVYFFRLRRCQKTKQEPLRNENLGEQPMDGSINHNHSHRIHVWYINLHLVVG